MRSRRLAITLVVMLVMVALLAAGSFALAQHSSAPRTSSPTPTSAPAPGGALQLHPERAGLTCPVDVAWSPNSRAVALVGYSLCPNTPTLASAHRRPQGMLLLYDTTTGGRIGSLQPDQMVAQTIKLRLHAINATLGEDAAPYIRYQTVQWSPDGRLIAIPFVVDYSRAPRAPPFLPSEQARLSATPTVAGVLLADATHLDTQHIRIITAPYHESVLPLEWNLTTGKPLSTALTLAPSLVYHWGAHGTLLARAPLSPGATGAASVGAAGPVGNPDGGASFTLWQPGELAPAYLAQNSGIYTSVPGACFWYSQLAAWSPDGVYLMTPGYVGAQIVDSSLTTPDPAELSAALATTSMGQPASLVPRDAALLSLCQRMLPDSSGFAAPAQAIAWRPDGKWLAATPDPYLNNIAAAGAAQSGVITLYASTTGKPVKTLAIPADTQAPLTNLLSEQSLWLRWSPDGARLLLLDLYTGTCTVWQPLAIGD
ncbi:MAG TPA: hypothetical protein VKQ36_12415 [Ktedonobacterales bacterium]|nr:hypothetical protein [Ktedonobacterales bacterium]